VFAESDAKECRKIPLSDNNMRERTIDTSQDLCDQRSDQFETSRFALQVHEATHVIKDAHLITYVRYVMKIDIKKCFFIVLQTY
jgi:hypothetical protein